MKNLYLSEIFSAIQGEGPLVGVRQIFVRFSACDLRCSWCDTPNSLIRSKTYQIERTPGSRSYFSGENPISISSLISHISKLNPKLHHSISFTGGEPLLQNDALNEIIPKIKSKFSLETYLETGGHRPDKLKNVINYFDYISMDFKLPSSSSTLPMWDKHKEFLFIALKSKKLKKIWVKLVLTKNTKYSELAKSIALVKSLKSRKNIEVFLQPVTKMKNIVPPEEKELLLIHSKLLKLYPSIRVLPQVHKLIGQK